MDAYILHQQIPASEVYQQLRIRAGLSPKSAAAARGLPNTLFSAVVTCADQPVGMVRVIGDGGTACQVVDICVLPEHQGRGLGKMIMQSIQHYLLTLPPSCYVSLLADGQASALYA